MSKVKQDKPAKNLTNTAKQTSREKLQSEVEEFLNNGNSITVVPLHKSKKHVRGFDEL